MFGKQFVAKAALSLLVISSLLLNGTPVRGNELVPGEDLNGGASVFVFRGSSKRPQAAGASASGFRSAGGSAAARRVRVKNQLAANRKKKRMLQKRGQRHRKSRASESVAKLETVDTLTTVRKHYLPREMSTVRSLFSARHQE